MGFTALFLCLFITRGDLLFAPFGVNDVASRNAPDGAISQALLIGGGCPEGAGDGTLNAKISRSDTCFYVTHSAEHFFYESRGVVPCRTPVVLHFLSFPGKKGNEAKERNRRQGKIRLYSGGAAARP